MKFSCHVTADVTNNAGLLEWNTNEIVPNFPHVVEIILNNLILLKSALLTLRFLIPSDIYR